MMIICTQRQSTANLAPGCVFADQSLSLKWSIHPNQLIRLKLLVKCSATYVFPVDCYFHSQKMCMLAVFVAS